MLSKVILVNCGNCQCAIFIDLLHIYLVDKQFRVLHVDVNFTHEQLLVCVC